MINPNLNGDILKEGSRLIYESTPKKLIKTVDMYPNLNGFDREKLYKEERIKSIKS